MIDKCIEEPASDDDFGVNAKLVWKLRKAIDNAYLDWAIINNSNNNKDIHIAKIWCENIKIIVTGGFNVKK